MAIRDFGTSLLADVRARKDAQARDARKYAKKQQRKELLIAGGAFLGSELFKIGNAAVAEKTQDFLANSEFQNNKILVNKFEKELTSAILDREAAETQGISLQEYYLNQEADFVLAQKKITKPEMYKEGDDSFWKAAYIKNKEVINNATSKKENNDYFYSKGTAFKAGKNSAKTLASLAQRQKNKGFGGRLLDKITGNTTTLDAFNTSMNNLTQVKIAKELYNLTPVNIKAGETVAALTGSVSEGLKASGINLTDDRRKEVLANIKKGYKTTYNVDFATLENGQMISRSVSTTTNNQDQVVEPPKITTSNVGEKGKPLTIEEMNTIANQNEKIYDNVRGLVTDQGFEDFLSKASLKGLIKNPEDRTFIDLLKLQNFALDYSNYTTIENFRPDLSEAELEARAVVLKEADDSLSIMLNTQSTQAEKDAEQERILNVISMITNVNMGQEGLQLTPRLRQSNEVQEKSMQNSMPPPAYPDAKRGQDGEYYIPDPNRAGKFLKVTGI